MARKAEKREVVESLKEKLQRAQGAVLTDYRGLNVAQMTELRRRLREAGIEYKVVKNTLTWRAAQEIGMLDLESYLKGPTAIAFGYDDPVVPAKTLSDFSKEHKELEIKAGILNGAVIDVSKVKELANLPSKDELLAKVAGGIKAPLAGFAFVTSGLLRSLVAVIDAVRTQREEQAS